MTKAADTRLNILQKAFELIYANGYQATSIDEIIASTNVTKGAFFYHFKNKDDMGLALIKEVMYAAMYPALVQPLMTSKDPVKDIYDMMKDILLKHPFIKPKYGCPANNLIQEMAPVNAQFAKALSVLVTQWENALATSVNAGKKSGRIRKDVNGKQVANFVMSGYGGVRTLGRLYNNTEPYKVYLKELKAYLEKLK